MLRIPFRRPSTHAYQRQPTRAPLLPCLHSTPARLSQMDYLRVVERVLKLALPSTYAWLLCFYALFHLWLNVLAELTRFGDREFYKVRRARQCTTKRV